MQSSLPNNSIPHNYKIKLIPSINPQNPFCKGESEILLEVLTPTTCLTLNAFELVIDADEITLIKNDEQFQVDYHILKSEINSLEIGFNEELIPGNYVLHLKYSFMLNNDKRGMFLDFYENENNEKIYFVSTFFEPKQACQVFPCWDEPKFKATFDISIKHFPNYTALSNMPIKKQTDEIEYGGQIWTEFETTPLMSTYMVAFMVSDFHCNNLEEHVAVWCRKSQLELMLFSNIVSVQALALLEKFTNMSYELPKLDIVAIPNFKNGGMENWGLIMFREDDIFRDDDSLMHENFEATGYLIQKIAQQWFGNLITPASWEDIWITKGLAVYCENLFSEQILSHPRSVDRLNVRNKFEGFDTECCLNVSPNVKEKWDSTYHQMVCQGKAGEIMYMLSCILSEEVFHNGIRNVLQKYKYQTISTQDFLQLMQDELENSTLPHKNLSVIEIMNSYIYQSEYPVVTVIRGYSSGEIKISQEPNTHYLSSNVIEDEDEYEDKKERKQKWWIPINFTTNSSLGFHSTLPTHFLTPEDKEIIIEGVDPNDWIIVNIKRSGYYRVNYDRTNWNRIVRHLQSQTSWQIHALNRAQIIEDASEFEKAQKIDPTILPNLLSYLCRQND